jgi:type IV secretory pathway VirB4 component
MEIPKRMFVFGKTGSGKSTFLNILLGSSEDNDGPFDVF